MTDRDEVEVRIRAMKQLLSQSDIDELYGADEATLRKIQSLADSKIPTEVDEAVSMFLSEFDIRIGEIEPNVEPVLRILFLAGRVKSWELKQRVLATKVEKWIIRLPTQTAEARTPAPSIYHTSCPECGETFDEKRYVCPECWAQVNER